MRTVGPRLAAGLITAGLVLAGCGGSADPKPLPAPSKSPSPSASPSDVPAPPVLPEAAKAKSDAAVAVFARHYVDVINYTALTGDDGVLLGLSAFDCESCRAISQRAATTYAAGGYIRGTGWTVTQSNVLPKQPRSRVYVELTINQAPETVLTAAGEAPKQYPGGTHTFNMVVTKRGAAWRVKRLDLVA
jgi:hypothetical protein